MSDPTRIHNDPGLRHADQRLGQPGSATAGTPASGAPTPGGPTSSEPTSPEPSFSEPRSSAPGAASMPPPQGRPASGASTYAGGRMSPATSWSTCLVSRSRRSGSRVNAYGASTRKTRSVRGSYRAKKVTS